MSILTAAAAGTSDLATPLEIAQRFMNAAASVRADSLPEYTAPSRLSSLTIIDSSILNMDQAVSKDLLQTMLSIYSAMYLSAIKMELNIGDINVHRLLDKFATDRDILRAAGSSDWLAQGFDTLCAQHIMSSSENRASFVDLEAIDWQGGEFPRNWQSSSKVPLAETKGKLDLDLESFLPVDPESFSAGSGTGGTEREVLKQWIENENIAVGKIIEVPISSGDHHTTMLVTAQLVPTVMSPTDITTIVQVNSIDKSYSARWHAMRSGQIRFVKDWILALDLIEADKKALLADKTGTLLTARTRRSKNIIAALASGRASPNAVSSMMLVSKSTARQMEMALGGKLNRQSIINRFWESNVMMMLVVVDLETERFTIYTRGISTPGDYTLDDIRGNGKKANGVDMDAVLKAYKLGNTISL